MNYSTGDRIFGISGAVAITTALLIAIGAELAFSKQGVARDSDREAHIYDPEMSETEKLNAHEEMLREWGMPMHRRDLYRELAGRNAKSGGFGKLDWVDGEIRKRGFDAASLERLVTEVPGEIGDDPEERGVAQAWQAAGVEVVRLQVEAANLEEVGELEILNRHRADFDRLVDRDSLKGLRADERSEAFVRAASRIESQRKLEISEEKSKK